jgi:hypothetical protein
MNALSIAISPYTTKSYRGFILTVFYPLDPRDQVPGRRVVAEFLFFKMMDHNIRDIGKDAVYTPGK